MSKKQMPIGIAWYTKAQWPEYRRAMTDEVYETFEEWFAQATELEAKLKKEGADVARVPVDIGNFEIWCHRKKLAKDADARATYVVEMMGKNDPKRLPDPTLASGMPPRGREPRRR